MSNTRTISVTVSGYDRARVDAAVNTLNAQFPFASRGSHRLSKTLRVPTINVFAEASAISADVYASIRKALGA